MLIDDLFTQQMRADGEQKRSERGGSDHHLIKTAQRLNLRTDVLYG